jgi:LysR family transcriptional regulator, regulator for genes of the gallate degradation pathway
MAANLRHLSGILAVAECGTLSAAARQINLSQPALTQAVAKIEKQLGIPLYERHASRMITTEPGKLFLRRVARGFDYLKRGSAAIGGAPAHFHRLVSASQLRALIAAVEEGGFVQGAASLGRGVSTVNRACRELERLAGVPLFETTSGGIRATRQATEFSRLCRLGLTEFRQGYDDVRNWQGDFEGRLSIGCLPLAQSTLLPAALDCLAREYPRVSPTVMDGYYASLARALLRGDLDMILGALRAGDLPDELEQTVLFQDPLEIVAHPDHPLAGKANVTRDMLAEFPWIAPRTGAPARAYFEKLHASLDTPPGLPRPIETGSHTVMRGLLMISDRLTLISAEQVKRDIGLGLLARIDTGVPGSARPIGVTVRAGWSPSLPQARFLEILRQVVAGR